MGAFALPLDAGLVTAADGLSEAPAQLTNWVIDAASVSHPRPAINSSGLGITTGALAQPLIGMYVWRNYLIGVSVGRVIYYMPLTGPLTWVAISDSSGSSQLDGSSRPVFAEDGLRVIIAGGGELQQWTGVGLSTRLGGGPFASHVVTLGSRVVANNINSPQEWAWSNVGDGVHGTWDALAFTTADARPDAVVAVHENLRELFVFGESTIQVYNVSSDPLNPFDNVISANVGTTAAYSIVRMDDAFAFLDDKRRFVLSDGRSVQVLSDAISPDLRDLTTISDCWGYREDFEQYNHIVWVFPAAGRCFAYDTNRKAWSERYWYDDTTDSQGAMQVGCFTYVPYKNWHLLADLTLVVTRRLTSDLRIDGDSVSGVLLCERTTGVHDMGTKNRKRDQRLMVTMRRNTSASSSTQEQLEIRARDDQGAWSDWEFIAIGVVSDESDPTVQVRIGGVFRRRQYQFRYSGKSALSLVSAVQEFEELTS